MKKKTQLRFNELAPDVDLQNTQGESVRLADFWAGRPLLLAFTRHFGCTQCKEMLDEISAGQEKIRQAGLEIVVITQGTYQEAAEFCAHFAPGLTCLADPERKAYQAYRLERGTVFQTLINPRVWRAVSNSSRTKGYKVEPPPTGQDAMQLAGTFIISTAGRIELPYYYDDIADHPPLDLLLKGALSTDWSKPFEGPLGPAHN